MNSKAFEALNDEIREIKTLLDDSVTYMGDPDSENVDTYVMDRCDYI